MSIVMIYASGLLILTILLIQFFILRKVNKLFSSSSEDIKDELIARLDINEENLKEGVNEFRKELREVSLENRKEINELFKGFQSVLLERVNENNELQNKLTNESSKALNEKQDEFREKTIESLSELNSGIKNDAKDNRKELNEGLRSFEIKFSEGINEFSEQLRHKFFDLNQQQQDANQLAKNSILEIKDDIGKQHKLTGEFSKALSKKQDEFREKTIESLSKLNSSIKSDAKDNRKELNEGLRAFEIKFSEGINDFSTQLRQKFFDFNQQQQDANQQAKNSILEIKDDIGKQLKSIREDNTQQLNEIRHTVDEKLHETLEKRLGDSFQLVSERLEQVHKGLGEMQNLAIGVGDLKKVLSNVKTRGILGEYQLGNILEQILSPEQYGENIATKKGSQANVEYAVKLPGKGNEKTVWIPIDSKFPLSSYQELLQALEEGHSVNVEIAEKALLKSIESFAKDISVKYIDPPNTTDFAIMFLPIEGLYTEVLRHPEIFEKLQRTHRITITGPTTLSALLNSLNMGFRTLAVQKRSSEVWNVLAEVKTEFIKYAEQLEKVQKQLNTASGSLENLQLTRTNAMEKKLRGIEHLEKGQINNNHYLN